MCNTNQCSCFDGILQALRNLFSTGCGCGNNNGCGCNNGCGNNNGCGCNNGCGNNNCGCNRPAAVGVFGVYNTPFANNGYGNNGGTPVRTVGRNGCGCNNGCGNNNGCGCGNNYDLSALTNCGTHDCYYIRQYALYGNGCNTCNTASFLGL